MNERSDTGRFALPLFVAVLRKEFDEPPRGLPEQTHGDSRDNVSHGGR